MHSHFDNLALVDIKDVTKAYAPSLFSDGAFFVPRKPRTRVCTQTLCGDEWEEHVIAEGDDMLVA